MKYEQKILKLLKAISPKQVAVMHCQGHQKEQMTAVQGNQKADREAKQAAFTGQTSASLAAALFLCPLSKWAP
jgi:hypothetical protein